MRNLVSTSALINEYFADVLTALPSILAFGLGAGGVAAFAYVFVMQYIRRMVSWPKGVLRSRSAYL